MAIPVGCSSRDGKQMVKGRIHLYLLAFLAALPSVSAMADVNGPPITSPGLEEPLENFFQRVKALTGYTIKLKGQSEISVIPAWPASESPQSALIHFVAQIDAPNHISFINHENKVIRVVLMGSAQELGLSISESTQALESSSRVDEPFRFPETLTHDELAKVINDYHAHLTKLTKNTSMTPASENGSGVTLADRDEALASYQSDTDQESDSDVLSPGGEQGEGITRSELRQVKASYAQFVEQANEFDILSPSSERGQGILRLELEKAKEVYGRRPTGVAVVLTPGSGIGDGLTSGDVQRAVNVYESQHRSVVLD